MTAARAWLAGIALVSLLAGCTAGSLQVASARLGDEANYLWLASTVAGQRTRFAADDSKVTLAIRFAPNLIAYYELFRVEWVAPTGGIYLAEPVRTRWGSHQELAASLPIAGTPAARLSGRWQVRLYHQDRLLAEREFEVGGAVVAKESLAEADQADTGAPRPRATTISIPDRAPEE